MLAKNPERMKENSPGLDRGGKRGAILPWGKDPIDFYFPLPARNEWGEGQGEGFLILRPSLSHLPFAICHFFPKPKSREHTIHSSFVIRQCPGHPPTCNFQPATRNRRDSDRHTARHQH